MSASISLTNLVESNKKRSPLGLALRLLDKVVGVSKMNDIYQQHEMAGLSKEDFARRLLSVLNIQVLGGEALQNQIPKTGPLVIASNHPFGGIEGVILCLLIGQVRPDLKVLANQGLKLFPELSDYFIFTNPLSEKDPKNGASIRTSLKHVKQGHALLIFPAGRVSYYQDQKKRISDHKWNRIVAKLVESGQANYLPVFVSGENSRLFYRLGRIYFRLRLFMLARELLNKQNTSIKVSCGTAVKPNNYSTNGDLDELTSLLRAQSYCQDPKWQKAWPADKITRLKPLATEIEWSLIETELDALPREQLLITQKAFEVYFGYQNQLPNTVTEIARLRELVFREHNEGSGEPIDSDSFDATYTQLFVVNRQQKKVIGAYRMGRTDKLLENGGIDQLYLSKMFRFKPEFANLKQPCLELGRSFLIPEYQQSFHGLYLLWRGIGAFVCKYPKYRILYGTVSLSKLYDMRSVAIMKEALVTPTELVAPFAEFDFPLHDELGDFAKNSTLSNHLTPLLACIEQDSKDIPVLVKHYQKMGAIFHCLGIDKSFNDTPGLLLSVDLAKAPEKLLKLYLADGYKQYQDFLV